MKRGGFDYSSVAPLYNDLIQRGFSPIHAAAVAGNFAHESGLRGKIDYGINEQRPTVKGSRGGYGAAQWTGPRRRELESFAKQNGLDVSQRDTQMRFFDRERTGSEKRAFDRLQKTGDLDSATRSFMKNYERPGVPNLQSRLAHAREIYQMAQRGDFGSGPQSQTQIAKNEAQPSAKEYFEKRYAQNDAPLPPSRPGDLNQTMTAKNDAPLPPPRPTNLNDKPLTQLADYDPSKINRTPIYDTKTQILGQGDRQPASSMTAKNDAPLPPPRPGDLNQIMTAQNDAPLPPSRPAEMQLAQASPTNTPMPPIRPEGLSPTPTMMADAPLPPSRPGSFATPAPVQIARHPTGGMNNMLMEPQGGGGGIEGMAGGQQMAQMSPEMMSPQAMGGAQPGLFGDGLGGLFADAFMPDMQQTQFADAGMDFGGGFGDFGGGLAGLFG